MTIYLCSTHDGPIKAVRTQHDGCDWILECLLDEYGDDEFIDMYNTFVAPDDRIFYPEDAEDKILLMFGNVNCYWVEELELEDEHVVPDAHCCGQCKPKPERTYQVHNL